LLIVMAAASNIILIGISAAVGRNIAAGWTEHTAVLQSSGMLMPLLIMLLLFGISFLCGLLIDTNKYSLHFFWQNRIARAYLRASRRVQTPPPETPIQDVTSVAFTDFDTADNLQMSQLQEQRPLHVINIALRSEEHTSELQSRVDL